MNAETFVTMNTTTTINSDHQKETSNFADALREKKTILSFSVDEIEEKKDLSWKKDGKLKLEIPQNIQEDTEKTSIIYKVLNAKTRKPEMLPPKTIETYLRPVLAFNDFVNCYHRYASIKVHFIKEELAKAYSTQTLVRCVFPQLVSMTEQQSLIRKSPREGKWDRECRVDLKQLCLPGSNLSNCNTTTAFYRGFVDGMYDDDLRDNLSADVRYLTRLIEMNLLAGIYRKSSEIAGMEVLSGCGTRSGQAPQVRLQIHRPNLSEMQAEQ